MDELSLVISNPNEGDFLKSIEWNKEEFMQMVSVVTEKYNGITYTDDQMKMAKEDRAKLNAMKKAISDRRIQIKKAIMEPYTQFEADVKEVVELIEKPIGMIDTQIKEYEEEQKRQKKEKLQEYFDKQVGELENTVRFDDVFEKQYLNQTFSLKKAKEEIKEKLEKIAFDIDTIRTTYPEEYVVPVMNVYLKDFDMGKASAEAFRLQELARQEEERLREEALKRERELKAREEMPYDAMVKGEEQVEDEPEKIEEPEKTVEPDVKKEPEKKDDKVYRAAFVAYGTKEQLTDLKEYMRSHGIKFGKE